MFTRGRQSPTLRLGCRDARWEWVPHGMGTPVTGAAVAPSQCKVQPDAPRMLPRGPGAPQGLRCGSAGELNSGSSHPWVQQWSLGRMHNSTWLSCAVPVLWLRCWCHGAGVMVSEPRLWCCAGAVLPALPHVALASAVPQQRSMSPVAAVPAGPGQ